MVDQEALELARLGKPEGFEYLFFELAGPVATFAARRGAADPEGLANSALFKSFEALGYFDGGYKQFCSYVYRTARNLLIDEYRRNDRRPNVVDLEHAPERAALDLSAADRVAGQDWVDEMLDQLTVDQRDVITLRVIGDQSLEQTAEAMGKPVSAVKALQRRALRRLHALTAEEGHTCVI